VKDENDDLLADSHYILNRWKNYFSHLMNVHRVSDVRQTEVYITESLVPYSSPFGDEIAIAKLKSLNCQVVIQNFIQDHPPKVKSKCI
jgi:hypothetical protein